ncbi:MAG: DedA family protein [Deltaproteobacteria bacterium]|nr:DedA family protein [Deltaproteobacteria bacterium]
MDLILYVFDIFIHLDKHLSMIIQNFGVWTYLIFFIVIFCETGLVVTPILPGDSLLFGLGYFAAIGALQIEILVAALACASICGDNVNYTIGRFVGPRVFYQENVRFLNKEYLSRAHQFYEKHGGKTIILAKYVPIIRTYAPFVAGIGSMTYRKYLTFNVIAGIAWVSTMTLSGYFFGDLPFVRNNFGVVVLAIIFISILPGIIHYIRQRKEIA